MDTILLATDFSPAAQNALYYGFELAKDTGSKLVLFHAYQTVAANADMLSLVTEEEIKLNIEERLIMEAKALTANPNDIVKIRTAKGKPCESVIAAAKELNAKYIIVGMKGTGQTMRRLFGSTAISLSRHASVPVIVVPEKAWYTTPKVIALASDIDEESNEHLLDPLKELGHKFDSKLVVVRVVVKGDHVPMEKLLSPHKLKWYLKELQPTYEFISDVDMVHSLNKVVEEKNIDMVVMVARDHTFLERIFIKSEVEEMLFESEVPVLVLPEKVISEELQNADIYTNEISI